MLHDQTNPMEPIKFYFFDTSAILKILCDEPGSKQTKALLDGNGACFTSWILIGEALGVLKRKWANGEIDKDKYLGKVHHLLCLIEDQALKPIDIKHENNVCKLITYDLHNWKQLSDKYPYLDAADFLQFLAIKEGVLGYVVAESKPRLVTADKNLGKAAQSEKIEVIFVNNESK